MKKLLIAIIMLSLFFLGVFIGCLMPLVAPSMSMEVWENVKRSLPSWLGEPRTLLAILIFLNNFRTTILLIVLGITIVIPCLIVVINGFLVGLAASLAIRSGFDIITVLIAILPHGVFEVSALIYSAVVGIYFGVWVIQKLFFRRGCSSAEVLRDLLFSIVIIAVLLLIAAFIEVFVTMRIVPIGRS